MIWGGGGRDPGMKYPSCTGPPLGDLGWVSLGIVPPVGAPGWIVCEGGLGSGGGVLWGHWVGVRGIPNILVSPKSRFVVDLRNPPLIHPPLCTFPLPSPLVPSLSSPQISLRKCPVIFFRILLLFHPWSFLFPRSLPTLFPIFLSSRFPFLACCILPLHIPPFCIFLHSAFLPNRRGETPDNHTTRLLTPEGSADLRESVETGTGEHIPHA